MSNTRIKEIEALLKVDKEAGRTRARQVITETTGHIVSAFHERQEMMRLIAESKTGEGNSSILQLGREYELVDIFYDISEKEGINPELVSMLVWFLMSAGKERQRNILQRKGVFLNEVFDKNTLKKSLIELTEIASKDYDNYGTGFSATKESRQLEDAFIKKILKKISLDNRGLAVDLGCANGRVAKKLSEEGFYKVKAYDISPHFINVAKQDGNYKNIDFEVYDLDNGIPLEDNSVDLLIANFGTGSEIENIISEINRVLKKGGRAFVTFYNKDSILNKWWLPWKPSIEPVINFESDIVELPIKDNGKTKVYKIYAKSYNMDMIHREMKTTSLEIKEIYSFPTIIQLMPNLFFDDSQKIAHINEFEILHADIKPYLGTYLSIEFKK